MGASSLASLNTSSSKPSLSANSWIALYQSGLLNCWWKMPAISRATPSCPKQSGLCVNILFSISSTQSSSPNTSAKLAPAWSVTPSGISRSLISIIPSWSVPIASSSAAASIPWLKIPRSGRASSTNGSASSKLAGTVLFGGNQIAHISAWTFGAPQTTCT